MLSAQKVLGTGALAMVLLLFLKGRQKWNEGRQEMITERSRRTGPTKPGLARDLPPVQQINCVYNIPAKWCSSCAVRAGQTWWEPVVREGESLEERSLQSRIIRKTDGACITAD